MNKAVCAILLCSVLSLTGCGGAPRTMDQRVSDLNAHRVTYSLEKGHDIGWVTQTEVKKVEGLGVGVVVIRYLFPGADTLLHATVIPYRSIPIGTDVKELVHVRTSGERVGWSQSMIFIKE